jgi:multidrug resistance efflux pump
LAVLEKEIILKQDQHNKLSALVLNANEKLAEVDSIQAKLDRLSTKLNNNSFGPGESRQIALSDLTRYKTDLDRAQDISNQSSKVVYDYVLEVKKSDLFGWV